ncbi:MAG: trypsin-like serine protease [Thermoplasmatota archaeon]
MRAVRALFAVLLVALFVPLPVADAGGNVIQPGQYVETNTGYCTLNFVYDGIGAAAGRVFIGTAAHCVPGVGANARLDGIGVFGQVAFVGNQNQIRNDYALIEIDPALHGHVRAYVRGHSDAPTGVAYPEDTNTGDLVEQSGWGTGFDLLAPTREDRVGVLTRHGQDSWAFVGAMNYGDSGGPLFMADSGLALGIESSLCLGFCTDEGPTVSRLIQQATNAGIPIELRTV